MSKRKISQQSSSKRSRLQGRYAETEQNDQGNEEDYSIWGRAICGELSTRYQLPKILGWLHHNAAARNQYFARMSYVKVRNRFRKQGIKSGNKVRVDDEESKARQWRAADYVLNIQKAIWESGVFPYDFTLAMEMGAGNCGEMSGIAAQMINRNGGYAAQYRVDNKGTHAFTLVGQTPAGAVDHVAFSDYKGCWVVDPWAGIVCKAANYVEEFRRKMNLWARNGKYILNHGEWIFANDPAWLNAVVNGYKCATLNPTDFNLDRT